MAERQKGWVHVPSMEERLAKEDAYGESVRNWLLQKMPDVCKQDPKVVDGHRRCYGDAEATTLASSSEPHHAATAAVYRLHQRYGKGSLTVREHGPEIRSAVKTANVEAIAEYELIASNREKE